MKKSQFIASILVVVFLFSLNPQKAQAQWDDPQKTLAKWDDRSDELPGLVSDETMIVMAVGLVAIVSGYFIYKAIKKNQENKLQVSANESFAQTFGVKAGLNLADMLMKDDDETYSEDFKMNPGFHLGLTAEFPLTDMVSFEPGLLLSTKGFKMSGEETFMGETFKYEGKMNLFYLDIPLTAKAYFDIEGTRIYGVFGPYLGMGLSGKSKSEVTYNGEKETEEEDIKWGSDEDDDLKRLDFGLSVGAGFEIKSIQIGLSYNLGLANISTYTDEGFKINNRVLGISIGYKFGGN